MAFASSPQENTLQSEKTIQLGRMSSQPWRKTLHFVSPSYRAKAFWGLAGVGCIVFLWSVLQAFLAADIAAFDTLDRLSFNYSMVFTIVIGLLLAGLCVVISFQGVSLRLVHRRVVEVTDDDLRDGFVRDSGGLELRQSFKKPRHFPLSTYKYSRIISNELSQTRSTNTQRQLKQSGESQSYTNALKNNSTTIVISLEKATLSFECQDKNALEMLKKHLDDSKQ